LCGALSRKGYGFPTPIQRRVIPSVLAGRDVVAMARTGSGKTASFLAPLLHRLAAAPRALAAAARRNGPRALVVAPTRELALQTLRFYKAYGREMDPPVRATVLVGGTPLEAQFEALAVCPELVVATPGRLLQMLAEMGVKGGLTLSSVEILVLDEADRLFEGTLAPETRAVLAQLTPESEVNGPDRQTVLVSATMPRALAEFTRTCLRPNVDVLRLDAEKTLSPTLAMAFAVTRSGDEKVASLITVVRRIMSEDETRSMVIFAATHRAVEYLLQVLRSVLRGHSSADESAGIVCVHGSLDQGARVEAVAQFRKRLARVLVVTDVAARGIDLPDLDVVINFDVAPAPKLFVHRVGRVGRAGRPGMAINLVSADEMPYVIDTLLFLGRGVAFADDPDTERGRARGEGQAGADAWEQHAVAMETTFLIGGLPKSCVDDDVEVLNKHIARNCEIDKLRQSSVNAHGLYTKTRALASGESVRRAKILYDDGKGGSVPLAVHPWFQNMESVGERAARKHVAELSSWRPREMAVPAPRALKRKRAGGDAVGADASDDGGESDGERAVASRDGTLRAVATSETPRESWKGKKLSSRQAAMEAQRAQFYVPLRRGEGDVRNEQAMQLGRDGSRVDGDGLGAFRAVQAATMDMVADSNTDMLREKNKGGRNDMFWDRVSKKFIKGGVTSKTSKQNVHVATREAKARASGGTSMAAYGTADGTMFKAWLNKNRKVIDQMREAGGVGGQNDGLGSQDFRKGAHGRVARIAAIAARGRAGADGGGDGGGGGGGGRGGRSQVGTGFRSARPELKSAAQIKKERKVKQKTEARRLAKSKGRGKQGGPALPRPEKRTGAPNRSKTLVYKKGGSKRST
jgi:ATP-dependent RNA helicase DDX54/DBP10